MKSLVVYYSLDGHTRQIAEIIAKEAGAELYALTPAKSTGKAGFAKYFLGGMRASFGMKAALKETLPDVSSYDRVIIGTPVWAGKPSPAVNTFLSGCDMTSKKVLLFACSGGGGDAKCFDAMKKRLRGGSVLGQIGFSEASQESSDAAKERVKTWLTSAVN
jgi:flavodoxin